MIKTFSLFFLILSSTYGQVSGCTDPLSKNYNPSATLNDGSCLYQNLKIKPEYSIRLSDSVKETSGLIAFDNLLWTHNDDHDTTVYGLDSLGKIRKKVILKPVLNQDWEEISQDSTHLYLGDFGNNLHGNRNDLHILKIEKRGFTEENPIIDTISFSYSDQNDFKPQKGNTTNFDCEAFIVSKDSIYIFSKQWDSSKTHIYALPNQPGNHIAQYKESIDTKGLVTGATYLESKKLVVLCGYSKTGKTFLYLLYDFKDHHFSSGNKRKIALKLPFHQIEGIATKDGLHYYLTNESLTRKPILNVPQQMHYFDLSTLLNSYLNQL
ncbi:T9SS C-terminal target domain-containing protein [Flavobacterium sp. Fl-318]|uniref:T9SS C-terminal target domain-containing protein n=1 Tax=Flavobacterium cupriresistens TaxID=2893885 RepID=A0ABU4REU0_9FLAO|nr:MULTISPECIES: T9SS C-terminal target domain-containing protein [unclassified Flavobacterium]MDX6191119.1 T9SS C-terminal target domain-containing protein [Flavobacterium sp. Fl-318]UFH42561.1 T9SS C-terminal target domain-containing protein [Flavobacterium sp. F-323]